MAQLMSSTYWTSRRWTVAEQPLGGSDRVMLRLPVSGAPCLPCPFPVSLIFITTSPSFASILSAFHVRSFFASSQELTAVFLGTVRPEGAMIAMKLFLVSPYFM